MKKSFIHFVLLVLFTIGVTAGVSAQEATFYKRAQFQLTDGTEITGKDVIVNNVSSTISFRKGSNTESYSMKDLQSLSLSNSDLSRRSAILGGLAGLLTPVLIQIYLNHVEKHGFLGLGSVKPKNEHNIMWVSILTIPVGAMLGHLIGSQMYVKWEEFDLNEPVINRQAIFSYPSNNAFRIGVKLPIR